jgi:small-conductance mechanosensitive channel
VSLLATTQRRALDEKIRATLDQRVDNQHLLADAYAGWIAVLSAQERAVVNRALREVALMLAVVLVALLLARWIEHALGARATDRRRTQTLYMVTRVSLQVVAALLILLVIFGPPDNLGTIVGLAGAGLTVALKDFILGFIGWFVLMGRDGIRIGDLVEINGVTGEVVELGMFHTVLLETGDWNEPGHPTGRRVTFSNSFAIEGHYFNFSTSGRWLWDDVRIVVPAGRDPHPIAEALRKLVEEATSESAGEAEAQWKAARRSPQVATPVAAASVRLKPIAGGVEITVRYITRVTEREGLRGKLYHVALEMLGGAKVVAGA